MREISQKAQKGARTKDEIAFNSVTFFYPGTKRKVLNGVSLRVKMGEFEKDASAL